MESEPEPFGSLLRSFRIRNKLTQEELAEKSNLSVRAISDLERGIKLTPRRDTIELLAQALNLTEEEKARFDQSARAHRYTGQKVLIGRLMPISLTPFVGREKEIKDIIDILQKPYVRLLTLTGPGGTGKTRMAMELVKRLDDTLLEGIYLVPLAPVMDPELVPHVIARTLEVDESISTNVLSNIVGFIQNKRLLIVLDNFEHLVSKASFVADLIANAPNLKVIVTSRAPLQIYGENIYSIPPMTLPSSPNITSSEAMKYESVNLFVQRANAIIPNFQLNDNNASTIVEICRRVDGLPLAIELAASRINVLTPSALLERLREPMKVLTRGAQDAPPRHQALKNTIDWSYELLSPSERKLFARLSVFTGGRSLEAIERICLLSEDEFNESIIDMIESLVQQSLLRRDESFSGQPRFYMLETIHEYARLKLEESGEGDLLRQRHLAYFYDLSVRARYELEAGINQEYWVKVLDEEIGNLRSALSWATDKSPETALTLAANLWRFWQIRGYLLEGSRWLDAALRAADNARDEIKAEALHGLGVLAHGQGNYNSADKYYQQSLQIFESTQNKEGISHLLHALGTLAWMRGELDKAEDLFSRSLEIRKQLGDPRQIAVALNNYGYIALLKGKLDTAEAMCADSLVLSRTNKDSWCTALSLSNLGRIYLEKGDIKLAIDSLLESIRLLEELGDKRDLAIALTNLACCYMTVDKSIEAKVHLSRALQTLLELGNKLDIAYCIETAAQLAITRGEMAVGADMASTAEYLRRSIGYELPPIEKDRHKRYVLESISLESFELGNSRDIKHAIYWEKEIDKCLEWLNS